MSGRTLSVDEQLARARSAEKNGNLGEAAQIYGAIVQRDPANKLAKKRLKAIQKSGNAAAPSSAEFKQLVGLYNEGRLPEVIAQGTTLCTRYPAFAPLHNLLGVVNARLGQLDEALTHYDNALSAKPDYAEVHNNRGNTLNRMGRQAEAIASFQAALRAMPSYVEAHNNLGNAFHDAGQLDEAVASYSRALKLKPDYAEAHNNLGNVLVDIGKTGDALASFTRALQFNPRLAQAYNNIGNTLRAAGRYDEAAHNYAAAIRINPDYSQAYRGLGNTLNDQGLHRQAIDNLQRGIQLNPDSAAAHNDLGNALSDMGRHEDAVASYHAALKINPDFAEVHSNLGNALCEFGNYDEAIANYNEALRLKPEFAEAHNNLSKIKKYDKDDAQLVQMLERLADPGLSESERMYLSFALGKAYEDIGDIDRSFEYLLQANQLRKKELNYDISSDQAHFALIKSLFSGASLPALEDAETARKYPKKPIFILGMPRSGTTLTEQILASHSRVFGAGELQAVSRILSPLLRDMAITGKQEINPDVLSGLRDTYLGELAEMGDDEPFVTDKMPANFKWIGFLLAAMPGTKIINLQRDPAASCWSMFRILFGGNGYTNDLVDLAEYYLLYEDLMEFWRQKFPDQVYDLNYEALTENQEQETRRLLEYCGLPWEEQCLEFHKTKRTVRTPSGKQVRKKMYTGSSAAWRRYEKHLQPMLSVLNR